MSRLRSSTLPGETRGSSRILNRADADNRRPRRSLIVPRRSVLARLAAESAPMNSLRAPRASRVLLALWLTPTLVLAADPSPQRLSVEPPDTVLDGRRASAQLIATGHGEEGSLQDMTRTG